MQGFSRILNLLPSSNYSSYIPTRPASHEAWEQVGNNMTKTLIVEALKFNISNDELEKLNAAIREMDASTLEKFTVEPSLQNSLINEQKKRDRREDSRNKHL